MLGPMRYAWGRWTANGANVFGHQEVRVRVPGTRQGLLPYVHPLLTQVATAYPQIKEGLLAELYDEFDGARDSLDDDVPDDVRSATNPTALWSHVTLVHAWVGAYGSQHDIELAYELAWDAEHTRGITVTDGRLSDYCGSVRRW